MANIKISELPSGVPTLAAEVPFVEGGTTKKGVRFPVLTTAQTTAGAAGVLGETSGGALIRSDGSALVQGGAKPATTAFVYGVGDSITEGIGLDSGTYTADNYVALVATALGKTVRNLGISGSVCGRWVAGQIASRAFNAGDQILVLPGFNDARYHGTSANALSQYAVTLRGLLAWLAVPDANKVYSQTDSSTPNPAMTRVGTWIAGATWAGVQAQSRCGLYSATSGDYVQATVSGDTVHIMLGGYLGFAGAVTVTIDGVAQGPGSISPTPLVGTTIDGGGQEWQPYLVSFSGLSAGSHTVRVTLAASANTLVGYIAGFDARSVAKPLVYVGSTPRMSAAGYAVSPANANDTIIRQYQDETERVCESLARDGLLVQFVDTDATWTPSAGNTNADNVHPLKVVHQLWAREFLSEIAKPTLGGAVNFSAPFVPGIVTIAADVTITADNAATYNGHTLVWSAAATVTLSNGLPLGFGFAGRPPASGNASVAVTGGPTMDGATSTITRTLAANKLFAVQGIANNTYVSTGA